MRKAATGFDPYGLPKFKIYSDARIGKKVIHKGFRGLRVGQQFRIHRRADDKASLRLRIAKNSCDS